MRTISAILLLLLMTCNVPAHPAVSEGAAGFNGLVDEFVNAYLPLHPTTATALGFHQFDAKLEDYSARGNEQVASSLKSYLAKFEAVDRGTLPVDSAADLDWVKSSIHSELLEIEDIQPWKKDPDTYSGGVTNGIFVIDRKSVV